DRGPMTTRIHPTAIIDPSASIGSGAEVGPYVIIGPAVSIGDDCVVGPHAVFERNVTLGRGCRVGPGAVIGTDPQDMQYAGEETWVDVGDGTRIREYATINRGSRAGARTR